MQHLPGDMDSNTDDDKMRLKSQILFKMKSRKTEHPYPPIPLTHTYTLEC